MIMVKDSGAGRVLLPGIPEWHQPCPSSRCRQEAAAESASLGCRVEAEPSVLAPLELLPRGFMTAESWSNCLILALSYKLKNSSLRRFLLQPVRFYRQFLFWQIDVFLLFPWAALCSKCLIVHNWFSCFLLRKSLQVCTAPTKSFWFLRSLFNILSAFSAESQPWNWEVTVATGCLTLP